MIRELGETIGNTVVESVGRAVGRSQERRPLPADLLESEDDFLAVFDAPGVERDDVQVRFEEGRVHVRMDRFREFHEGFEMRFPGRGLSLEGSVSLPDGAAVDPAGASAVLKRNGSLHVRIPKREHAGDGTVEVTEEGDDPGDGSPEESVAGDGSETDDGDEGERMANDEAEADSEHVAGDETDGDSEE